MGCLVRVPGGGDEFIPLGDEGFEVVVDVGLELADGLGREGVADYLALAGVLGPVAGVEEAAFDGDEGVVVGAVFFPLIFFFFWSFIVCGWGGLRLEETISMAVDYLDGFVVVDADVVGLDPDYGPEFLVHFIDSGVPFASPDDG